MNKTSVYLSDDERRHLAWLAKVEQRSQSEIIRAAIAAYEPRPVSDRKFTFFNTGDGPGDSVADYVEDELLKGFGEDSLGDYR